MGPCLSSGKDDMDKPVTRQHMKGAQKVQKASANKSKQAQKIAAAEQSGSLSMPGAKLKEIPAQVLGITKMTFLELSNNSIAAIPPSINSMARLKKLKLSRNKLTSIPDFSGLVSLDTLFLDNNSIMSMSSLPVKLKTLSLQQNALSAVPEGIKSLRNLEKLSLSKNGLSGKLPGWLGGLSYLKSLELDDNKIQSIDPGLGSANKLEKLMLRRNNLTEIPAALLKSKSLALMRLEGNKITKAKLMGSDGWEEFDAKRKALVNKQVSAGIGDFDRSVCGLD